MNDLLDGSVHIIDDDAAVRESLEALLTVIGFEVASYASAEHFIESISIARGCVLADVNMPGMSGFELLHRISLHPQPLPVILLTASQEDGQRERAFDLGASGFLNKPVVEADLLEALRSVGLVPGSA